MRALVKKIKEDLKFYYTVALDCVKDQYKKRKKIMLTIVLILIGVGIIFSWFNEGTKKTTLKYELLDGTSIVLDISGSDLYFNQNGENDIFIDLLDKKTGEQKALVRILSPALYRQQREAVLLSSSDEVSNIEENENFMSYFDIRAQKYVCIWSVGTNYGVLLEAKLSEEDWLKLWNSFDLKVKK